MDYVAQREITVGTPEPYPWPEQVEPVWLTPREREIVMLLGRGLNRRDICEVLKITSNSLRVHIFRMRKKSNDFDI